MSLQLANDGFGRAHAVCEIVRVESFVGIGRTLLVVSEPDVSLFLVDWRLLPLVEPTAQVGGEPDLGPVLDCLTTPGRVEVYGAKPAIDGCLVVAEVEHGLRPRPRVERQNDKPKQVLLALVDGVDEASKLLIGR